MNVSLNLDLDFDIIIDQLHCFQSLGVLLLVPDVEFLKLDA